MGDYDEKDLAVELKRCERKGVQPAKGEPFVDLGCRSPFCQLGNLRVIRDDSATPMQGPHRARGRASGLPASPGRGSGRL
jgi:hypothetical protein